MGTNCKRCNAESSNLLPVDDGTDRLAWWCRACVTSAALARPVVRRTTGKPPARTAR